MHRRTAMLFAAVALAAAPRVAFAANLIAALDLGFDTAAVSSARDVSEAGNVFVLGPFSSGFGASGTILLPPHPGGGVLTVPCGVLGDCFHRVDVPEGFAAGGRILGRIVSFGSGGPFVSQPVTWTANGSLLTGMPPFPGSYSFGGSVSDANASEVFVGGLFYQPLGVGVPVYWSSPTATPVQLANLASNAGPKPVRISDGGEIIGNRGGVTPRAVRWASPGAPAFVYLGELPGGATSQARDLDETSHIVGSSDAGGGVQAAVIWRPNGGGHTVETLPVPFAGGSCQEASAIEPGGWIAGNCIKAGGDRRGVIWRVSGATVTFEYELLPLDGETHSAVYALQGSALAVGSSGDPGRAVLWELAAQPVVVPALGPPAVFLLVATLSVAALRTRRLAR